METASQFRTGSGRNDSVVQRQSIVVATVARTRGKILVIGPSGIRSQSAISLFLGTTDKLVEHIARDLLDPCVAAAHLARVEPWIPTLKGECGAIIGTIRSLQAGEVVIESPAPL